jgi:hypothetical protein
MKIDKKYRNTFYLINGDKKEVIKVLVKFLGDIETEMNYISSNILGIYFNIDDKGIWQYWEIE